MLSKETLYLKKFFFIEIKLIYSVVPVSSVFHRGFTDVSIYSEELIRSQKVAEMGYHVKKKKKEGEGNVYTWTSPHVV